VVVSAGNVGRTVSVPKENLNTYGRAAESSRPFEFHHLPGTEAGGSIDLKKFCDVDWETYCLDIPLEDPFFVLVSNKQVGDEILNKTAKSTVTWFLARLRTIAIRKKTGELSCR
jgi:hypothetical protein